ncbi:hypothetical protein [Streptomyces sp. NPDC047869]|uniref:hypothetical protein n=1 Tax=Streptomyces sp. NPDC047869 TaxID=3154709 RepID=UPI003452EE4E
MTHAHRFHLDVEGHSVTVQTRHGARETELLVDGKVVDYLHARTGHREPTTALTAELPGDPPQSFRITLRFGEAPAYPAVCLMEFAGRSHPMPAIPLAQDDTTPSGMTRPSLRSTRRLVRSLLRRTHRR